MNFIKANKGKIGAALVVIIILAAAYFSGGKQKKNDVETVPLEAVHIEETDEISEAEPEKNEETAQKPEKTEEAAPKQEEKAENAEEKPQNEVQEEKSELYCTLSVNCETILSNISCFNPEKLDILPKNGVIFAEKKVEFTDGESVFDLLLREMKDNKIHMEFVNTPVYGTAYIEGIGNIYEFDAGELSGWMYRVNGEFPNFGCSKYLLKQGDKVEFVYTCDLGKDVGNRYVKGQVGENE